MNPIFSREGRGKLRDAAIIFMVCVAMSAVAIAASRWFLEKERRDIRAAGVRLAEATARVAKIRGERDNLVQSIEVFRAIVDRGLMQSERRLDFVELMNALRARHGILALDYEIAPQRALAFAGNRTFPAVDILASRVTLKLRALHEGDALAFIDSLGESRQLDRCVLRRLEASSPTALQPRVEADCTLEWITMREKRGA